MPNYNEVDGCHIIIKLTPPSAALLRGQCVYIVIIRHCYLRYIENYCANEGRRGDGEILMRHCNTPHERYTNLTIKKTTKARREHESEEFPRSDKVSIAKREERIFQNEKMTRACRLQSA